MSQASPRHYIMATAGHVDHGKSALVRHLTGTDPDRLAEEKARGITIDLGFAELRLGPSEADTTTYDIGLVDVPGHEDFVKNMVAGVGSIDAALLVVAADDGWMPQTEEHLQILTYLGVSAAVVALSKIDLTDAKQDAIDAVRRHLRGTPMADAPIIPISTVTGEGIGYLQAAIVAVLSKLPPPRDIGKPRLPVDRAFTLKGIGTVVTGTLIGGKLTRGQAMVVQPGGMPTRVRALQNHGRAIEAAVPGSRVALNLPDLQPHTGRSTSAAESVRRGDVVTVTAAGNTSRRLCVLLTRSERAASMSAGAQPPRAIKSGALVQLHHATSGIAARVRLLNAVGLEIGGRCTAILTTETPVLALAGDRFVLRDGSQQHTIAGGVILDPTAPTARRRTEAYLEAIRGSSDRPNDPLEYLGVQLMREGAIHRAKVLDQCQFDPTEVDQSITKAIGAGRAVAAGALIVERDLWIELRTGLQGQVSHHHKAHAEQTGLPLPDLRATLTRVIHRKVPKAMVSALLDAVIADVGNDGIVCANGLVRERSHMPALPPRLRDAGALVHKQLIERPFDPPSRKELCRTDLAQQALRFLTATGAAVELSPDVVVAAEAYARAVERVRAHLTTHGVATVSQLKTLLASNRRVMIPLLQTLDRQGITRRDGDVRRLR